MKKMKMSANENKIRSPGGSAKKPGQIKKGQKAPQIRYVGSMPVL